MVYIIFLIAATLIGHSFGQCNDDEFQCYAGGCISESWVCDGQYDCWDYSDESHCTEGTEPGDHVQSTTSTTLPFSTTASTTLDVTSSATAASISVPNQSSNGNTSQENTYLVASGNFTQLNTSSPNHIAANSTVHGTHISGKPCPFHLRLLCHSEQRRKIVKQMIARRQRKIESILKMILEVYGVEVSQDELTLFVTGYICKYTEDQIHRND